MNDQFSSWLDIVVGVPQGSIQGPLLLNIFFCYMFLFCNDIDFASYADDTLHEKPCFLFPDVVKNGHSKKIAPEYDLSCISGKDDIFFPENMILFFRRKMKDDLCRKKYMEIWYFLQMFWKDGLFKKIALEYDLSCLIWKESIFFPENMIFPFGRKMKDDLSQEIEGNMIFSVYTHRYYKHDVLPLRQKKSKMIFSSKNTLKGD